MTIKIRKFDWGKMEVMIERYGYAHTHSNVTPASAARIEKMVAGKKREFTRNYDTTITTVKM